MPKVSIGLPVYNGEDYVGAAVESLLAQTFTDFELVIVDNASTDRTGEICAAFAARDPRVRYVRNDRNIGGGPNQNRAFDLADKAAYFKLAAHDDIHGPRFLERCVEVLDRDPGVVLAFARADLIDADGKKIGERQLELELDAPDVLVRYKAILPSYDCMEVFGVMRRGALPPVPFGLFPDSDALLLMRMTLQGRFFEVPETLFYNRRHEGQAGKRFFGKPREFAAWWNPDNQGKRVFPQWRRIVELWRVLTHTPMSMKDRARCAVALARWTGWRRRRLLDDVTFHVKDMLGSAERPHR